MRPSSKLFLPLLFFIASIAVSFSFESLVNFVDPITVVAYRANACTGVIQIGQIQGGTGGYQYQWYKQTSSNPAVYSLLSGETSQSLSVTGYGVPGIYKLRITDSSGSFIEPEYPISQPYPLEGQTIFSGLVCSDDPNSGTLILRFTNGLSPYRWTLSKTPSGPTQTGTVLGINLIVNSLTTGTYNLTWTDDFGCTGQKEIIIDAATPINTQLTTTNVTCPGGSDGTATFNLSGGWGTPYAVKLVKVTASGEATVLDWTDLGTATTYAASNLSAGNYKIYYYDKIKNAPISTAYGYNVLNPLIYPICNKFRAFTITEPTPFNLNLTHSVAVCQGDTNGNITISPTGGTPSYQIDFYRGHFANPNAPDPAPLIAIGAPRTAGTSQLVSVNGLSAGLYSVLLTDANGCKKASNITIIENPKPIVADQTPPTVCSDTPVGVNFNSSTSVAAATYNVTALNLNGLTVSAGGAAVANGLTAAALADDAFTNTTTTAKNVVYTVVPVSAAGCLGNPFTVTVTVNPEPVVVNQTRTVCSDSPLTGFALGNDTDGAPAVVSYNITAINLNGLTISAGSPATGNGLPATVLADDAFTNTTSAAKDVVYNIVPVGDNGCLGNPFTVTVTVNPEPVVANQLKPICSDAPLGISFNPSTSIAAATYNITAINQNGLVASAGNPATGNGLAANVIADDAFTNNTNAAINVVYEVIPVSADGCLGNLFTLTVTVNPEPIVANQTVPTVCSDSPLGVNFNSSTSVAAATYNVTALNLNGLTVSAGGAAVANGLNVSALADDVFTNTTTAPVDVIYTVVPVSAAGCLGNPFTVTVTVNPEPVVVNQTRTVCSDSPLTGFALGNDADLPNVLSYNITAINLNGLTISAGSPATGNGLPATVLSDDAFTNTTSAAKDVVYTIVPVGDNGCLGNPFTVTVTVNPEPVVANQLKSICSDAPLGISFNPSTSIAAATYNITAITQNGLVASAGNPAPGNGLAANVIADDAFTNNTNAAVNVVYDVTPVSADGCLGNPFTLTVTVNPEPVVANQTRTVCSDASVGISFGNDPNLPNVVSYNITGLVLNSLTVSAGGAAVGNGLSAAALANDAFTNTTSNPIDVVYTVVPITALGCQGNPFTVTVTVNPEPAVVNQIITGCSDVPFTGFILGDDTNGPAVISYNITDINLNGLTVSAGNPIVDTGLSPFALADDAFTNTTNAAKDVVYTIVPVGDNGCLGNPFTVTATIKPEPVVANQLKSICSDAPLGINFNPSTSIAAATYNIIAITQNGLVASAGNPSTGTGLTANVIADDAFTNNTNAAIDVTYNVIPVSADGCLGNPFTLTVTVNPEPIVANQSLTVVGNGTVGLILGDDINGPNVSTYNITSIQSNGLIPGPGNIGIQNGVSQNAIASDTWSNPTNSTNSVIYTVVPITSTACQGSPFTVTITITAQPVVENQIITVCSDSPLTGFTLGNDTDGPSVVSYNITGINLNGLSVSAGSPTTGTGLLANVLADDAFTNTTSAAKDVVYTIVPVGNNGSFGDPFTVTATIKPEPVVANQLKPICSDAPLGISLNPSTSIAAATYNITAITQNGLVASAGNPSTGTGLAANVIA
ncbi:MAG: hypothetical protein NBV61_03175, partial [Algoriphagus sp.]|nr:hypothetical protein [Algoriphagus sp.]